MEEQLILLETAILCKEKGFDEPTFSYYEKGKLQTRAKDHFHNDNFYDGMGYIKHSAPTQSLLQKWLREKYNIHIHIIYNFGTYLYSIKKLNDVIQPDTSFKEFKSYEEALEIGLFEVLNLIKI